MQNDILILGFGISGQAAARLARELGMNPIPVDGKSYDWNGRSVFHWKEGCPLPETEYAVISPGISIHSAMAQAARNAGAAVIGELEFACRALPCRYVAITGTNGKTTTNNLLCSALEAEGKKVVCNHTGSNMLNGVAAAFAQNASLSGNLKADYACIEVDEASTVRIFPHFKPDYMVLTNLFRDQLDRYGEIDITMNLLKKGYVADDEIERFPGVTHKVGVHPVMECTQNIPCNPCQDACAKGCISIGDNITSLPVVVPGSKCIGCGMCVASCSGQAIFLVDEETEPGFGTVTLPYEFLPLPEAGEKGIALGRDGQKVCDCEVVSCKTAKAFDHTNLLTIKVPSDMTMKARFYKRA